MKLALIFLLFLIASCDMGPRYDEKERAYTDSVIRDTDKNIKKTDSILKLYKKDTAKLLK